jgi:hypothetical protein
MDSSLIDDPASADPNDGCEPITNAVDFLETLC